MIFNSTQDTYLHSAQPTSGHDGYGALYVLIENATPLVTRPIINFDFSSLPSSVITTATLRLYYLTTGGTGTCAGRTFYANELTQTGWVESQATWNSYKTGSAWATAGGDFTTTDRASCTVPAVSNWLEFNVKALVEHFIASHGKIANFLIKDDTESSEDYIGCGIADETDATYKPQLVITYPSLFKPQIMIF